MNPIIYVGDALDVCRTLPTASCQACITSPPYFRLRDYGVPGQLGLEETPQAYVDRLVQIFREIRRVLRDDGTLWIVLGDGFANRSDPWHAHLDAWSHRRFGHGGHKYDDILRPSRTVPPGLKPKNLLGIPWRVAFALQQDGWVLRADIIWHKPNALPESVRDRPVRAHEYVFLLSKSQRYYFDYQGIREPMKDASLKRLRQPTFDAQTGGAKDCRRGANPNRSARQTAEHLKQAEVMMRNARSVWTIPTRP
ncbi:MAG: site-specific DNA-methyltransferase, partial [Acidithiobacillus sp.]|nr:site-specific DNA-methyltransferase [Acidithiobacillus sp.]